jgi:pilus assembly protein Flp/PilA
MKPLDGERGATAVEYGLIVAAIAVVIVLAVVLVGRNLSGSFSDSADAVGNAVGGGGAGGGGATPTCPARSLGTVSVPKHTGAGDGTYPYNVLAGVSGGSLGSAASTGDGSISFSAGGTVTWTFPSGNRDATVSFGYSATGCTGGTGSVAFRAR